MQVLRASLHGIMPVAVKIISQDTAQKWLRVVDEIRIMKEKPCPYLVQYLGACIKVRHVNSLKHVPFETELLDVRRLT